MRENCPHHGLIATLGRVAHASVKLLESNANFTPHRITAIIRYVMIAVMREVTAKPDVVLITLLCRSENSWQRVFNSGTA